MVELSQTKHSNIWHPYTQMKTARSPVCIANGRGSYLQCSKGENYLDAISSWWVNLHGHSHPYIAEKLKEQIDRFEHVMFANFTHKPAIDLSEKLVSLLPEGLDKVFYSDNGSTAVEVALKMAIQYWYSLGKKKRKVICFKGGYHGDTFGAMSVSGKNDFNKAFWDQLFDVEVISPPLKGQEETSLKELKTALSKDDVACFIFEPLVLGVAGMLMYSPESLDLLLEECRKYDVITIADEVMTGFGRTETLFASEQLLASPDIICLAKGITGGFLPLGATICKSYIYDAFLFDDKRKALLHGHSYTANPLACTCGVASIDLLESSECKSQRDMISAYHKSFCQKWEGHPKLLRCESIGTILGLEYRSSSQTYFSSMCDRLIEFFHKKHIIIRPLGNTIHVLPPYCITKEELEYIYENIELTIEGNI